jgi:hypothetical protein
MIKKKNNITNMPDFTADASRNSSEGGYRNKVTVMTRDSILLAFDSARADCLIKCNDELQKKCDGYRLQAYAGLLPLAVSDECYSSIENDCNIRCPSQPPGGGGVPQGPSRPTG